jgi:hypothetical protein
MCAINRISIYVLLSILTNLCSMTYQAASAIMGIRGRSRTKQVLNLLSTAIPVLLAVVGYALEVEIGEGKNAQLNTARHAFSCSMRLEVPSTTVIARPFHVARIFFFSF